MNGRRTGGSRLWPSGSNEIRWCNAGCPSLPACLERNPPACRQWPDAQPDAVWADSASGTWHSPMAIFPASHQRIRWLSAGGWGRKNWRVFGGPPMYAIWDCMQNYIKPQSRKKYRRNSDFNYSWSTCHPTWRRVRWSIGTAHAQISCEKSLCINHDNYV